MKFDKIIGDSDDPKLKALIAQAQDKLSAVFTELSLGYDNKALGTLMGGDPLIFQLMYPLPHICDATSFQLDLMKAKEKELERKIAAGEEVSEDEKIPEDLKHFRKQMGKRVLRTAATDGRRFYWNPEFVVKQSRTGLRIVCSHEAWHAIFQQPARRGSRIPKLWNIAVDYKVNFTIMQDLKAREIPNGAEMFTKNLGEFITLAEYSALLKDPFHPPERLKKFGALEGLKKMLDPAYKIPGDNDEPMYYAEPNLSEEMKRPENVYDYLLAQIPKCPKCGRLGKYKKPDEYKALEKQLKAKMKKEAEEKAKAEGKDKKDKPKKHDHSKEHKHSEKEEECECPVHGKEAQEKKAAKEAAEAQKGEKAEKGEQAEKPGDGEKGEAKDGMGEGMPGGDEPGEGDCTCEGEGSGEGEGEGDGEGQDGCGNGKCGSCDECGGGCGDGEGDYEYIDPFGAGDTLDDHIDSDVSEEELAKRISDAIEVSKKMAGKVPGGLEDELGILVAPKLTWQDFLRTRILKTRMGFGKNDWTRPKSRPLFAGLYSPKKRDHFVNILAAYDCSGSMSQEDIAFGISQLQVIDERGEIFLLPWDTIPYWDKMIKIKKATPEELKRTKVHGRGGTQVGDVFNQYEEHCGKVDIIVIISDGHLGDGELHGVKLPDRNTTVLWLITSHNPGFKPPIGRVFHLMNE